MSIDCEEIMRTKLIDWVIKHYGGSYVDEIHITKLKASDGGTTFEIICTGKSRIFIKDCSITDQIKLFTALALKDQRKVKKTSTWINT